MLTWNSGFPSLCDIVAASGLHLFDFFRSLKPDSSRPSLMKHGVGDKGFVGVRARVLELRVMTRSCHRLLVCRH